MPTSRSFRRFAAGALVIAVIAEGSLLLGGVANAAPPAGTFTPSPSTGSDVSVITGLTDGTCDAPGTASEPVDGFNAVVTGPGAFAPDPAHGRPDGLAIVSTSDVGFSTTDPIRFTFRKNFHDLAQELGTTLQPGDYVVTFRCVNQFDSIVFQTFSVTFTFAGGPPATTYTVTNSPPASPSPNPSPSPSPSSSPSPSPTDSPTPTPTTTPDIATPTPATSTGDAAGATTSSDPGGGTQPLASTGTLAKTGAPIALIFLGGLILLAAGLALVVWLKRQRKAALSDGEDTSER